MDRGVSGSGGQSFRSLHITRNRSVSCIQGNLFSGAFGQLNWIMRSMQIQTVRTDLIQVDRVMCCRTKDLLDITFGKRNFTMRGIDFDGGVFSVCYIDVSMRRSGGNIAPDAVQL